MRRKIGIKEIEDMALGATVLGAGGGGDPYVGKLMAIEAIKKYGEECKVAVRNVRREAMDKMKAKKKDGELTEDDMKSGEKDVQKLTDKYCDKVDQHVSDKEKEIMSI